MSVAKPTTGTSHSPAPHLYLQVLVAIALGVAVGHFFPAFGEALKPLGDAFIKLVRMIIGPVVFLSLTTGIANAREHGLVGRVAVKTLGYFFVVSTLALVVGLVVANVVRPGDGLHVSAASLDSEKVADYVTKAHAAGIVPFLFAIIPDSLAGALTGTDLMPILLVAALTGISLGRAGERGLPFLGFLESAMDVVFRIVAMLMKLAPIGAFGAMAFTIGKYGVGAFANLAALIATFYGTSLLFVVVVLGGIARFSGFSLFRLVRYLKEELLLVLGTSSSEPALPSLMNKLEQAGCRKSVVSLVVPTGYSFNLDGTNIYMTLAALFIAQALDIPLTLTQQLSLLAVAMISSKGAAAVTGAGFITLAATLTIVPDVPVAGLALILGIDRFMSECRALTNFMGNAVATVVVAGWEGALDREQLRRTLGN
jgi:aerobic C4-dicarboxylate transport protein